MRKKNGLTPWLAIVALLSLATSCKDVAEEAQTRSVELSRPELVMSNSSRSFAGVVEEAHTINLGFKTAGQIAHIYIKEGDRIRKGQLLATLDADDYRLGVEALQLQYDQTKREVERLSQLFRERSLSANDYEKAVSGLKQLGVQLQSSKNQLSYTRLYAPCDASVQSVNLSAAEMVAAGTPVFTLIDDSRMEVVCSVRSEECGVKSEYYCRIAGSEETFPMRFVSLTPKADNSQLCQLRLAFEGKTNKRIMAGVNAEVIMSSPLGGELERGFFLPLTSIFEDATGKPSVWVMKTDSTLTKRDIVLSTKVLNGKAIVTGGLKGDEHIVRTAAATLQEGEKVCPLEKPKATNVGGLL